MRTWPKDYYCAERTLDIVLPWGGLTARIWFDGNTERWDDDKMLELANSVRRTDHWRSQEPQKLLDWLAALPDVNAVQVFRTHGNGVKVGVMAYLVPFEEHPLLRVDRQPVEFGPDFDH